MGHDDRSPVRDLEKRVKRLEKTVRRLEDELAEQSSAAEAARREARKQVRKAARKAARTVESVRRSADTEVAKATAKAKKQIERIIATTQGVPASEPFGDMPVDDGPEVTLAEVVVLSPESLEPNSDDEPGPAVAAPDSGSLVRPDPGRERAQAARPGPTCSPM